MRQIKMLSCCRCGVHICININGDQIGPTLNIRMAFSSAFTTYTYYLFIFYFFYFLLILREGMEEIGWFTTYIEVNTIGREFYGKISSLRLSSMKLPCSILWQLGHTFAQIWSSFEIDEILDCVLNERWLSYNIDRPSLLGMNSSRTGHWSLGSSFSSTHLCCLWNSCTSEHGKLRAQVMPSLNKVLGPKSLAHRRDVICYSSIIVRRTRKT